jgi:hypothetical protein
MNGRLVRRSQHLSIAQRLNVRNPPRVPHDGGELLFPREGTLEASETTKQIACSPSKTKKANGATSTGSPPAVLMRDRFEDDVGYAA